MALGYDNYATSFQSLMSPMGNIQANYNTNGYGNQMAGGMMGGYGGYGGYVTDPLMNQKNVDNVIAGDQYRNNYYGRPIPAHKKQDNLPVMLGILGTALGTAALALAAYKFKGKKLPVIPPTAGGAGAGSAIIQNPRTMTVTQGKPPYAPTHITVDPSTLRYAPGTKGLGTGSGVTGTQNPKTMTVTQGKPPYAPSHITVDPSTLKYAPGTKGQGTGNGVINVQKTATITSTGTQKALPPHATNSEPLHINKIIDKNGNTIYDNKPAIVNNGINNTAEAFQRKSPAQFANDFKKLPIGEQKKLYHQFTQGAVSPDKIFDKSGKLIYTSIPAAYTGANHAGNIKLPAHKPQLALPSHQSFAVQRTNENFLTAKPEMAKLGNIVYTTATPEQIAKANSIGEIATAKPLKTKPVKTQPKLNAQQLAAQQIAQHNNAVLAPIGLKINAKNLNQMKSLSPELYNEFITKFNTIAANKQTNALKALTMDYRFENLFKLA